MEDNFKDSPIQIVTIREDGDFEITVDGINFLSALKNKKVKYYQIKNIKFYQKNKLRKILII
jgi:hypothetical protein